MTTTTGFLENGEICQHTQETLTLLSCISYHLPTMSSELLQLMQLAPVVQVAHHLASRPVVHVSFPAVKCNSLIYFHTRQQISFLLSLCLVRSVRGFFLCIGYSQAFLIVWFHFCAGLLLISFLPKLCPLRLHEQKHRRSV